MSEWWQTSVVYQIYPRSFADTDGDGIGDLPGITAHLDYLASDPGGLGVDAIWLSPIYPSPWLDGGYDITDHAAIDPGLGTMDDFDRLVTAAHDRDLKVILDLVLNHTSDLHPWFQASRRSRLDPKADWYIWRDPASRDARGRPRPPNNWVSYFGGSAWTWDRRRAQYYLHTFLPQQPDMNWREPAVQAAQLEMVRGWLARGVDGFRLDVFNSLLKSPAFESNPVHRSRTRRRPWDRQHHLFDKDHPELGTLLQVFRDLVDQVPGRMSVGELFEGTVPLAAALTQPRHLVFDFSLLEAPWSADGFRRAIEGREALFGPDRWPTAVLSNHDRPRQVSRYLESLGRQDTETSDRLARAAAVVLLSDRGTAFLYYGEEIGLPNVEVPTAEIQDPPARRASPDFPWWNRDGCRSPMPWTADRGGGFTTGHPWIRLIPDAAERNVERQLREPNSVLAAYRRLLAVRRESAALTRGSLAMEPAAPDVLAFVREADGERVLVAVNFALDPRTLTLPAGSWRPLFDTDAATVAADPETGQLELSGLQAMLLRGRA